MTEDRIDWLIETYDLNEEEFLTVFRLSKNMLWGCAIHEKNFHGYLSVEFPESYLQI